MDEQGETKAILDWEDCTSNFASQWELSLALHDLGIDEKLEFLEGYGISEKKIAEIAPLTKAFNILNYAPEIERLAEAKDATRLEKYRTRLSGGLDLYSL